MVREQECQSKKSILPLSGLLAFLRPPPLHTVGLGTKASQEPGAEEQAFTPPTAHNAEAFTSSISLMRTERTMRNAAVTAVPTLLASIPLPDRRLASFSRLASSPAHVLALRICRRLSLCRPLVRELEAAGG